MKNFIDIKKIRGRYSKIDKQKLLFYDNPTTSCQDTFFIRDTDTSTVVNYPNNRYNYLKNLTDGSASIIYEAYDNIENKKVIIKKIKKNEHWRKELEVLEFLRNKNYNNILKMVDFFETHRRSYIVTEYYEGLDLFTHVELNAPYGEYDAYKIIKKMAECIKICHDNKIIHLDIKCENFMSKSKNLLDNSNSIKIVLIDFGHAETVDDIKKIKTGYNYGTLYYLCPEGYYNRIASSKSDIFSLGICINLLLTGNFPYRGFEKDYYKNSSNGIIELNKKLSKKSETLIKNCLNPDINKRWDIDKVFNYL